MPKKKPIKPATARLDDELKKARDEGMVIVFRMIDGNLHLFRQSFGFPSGEFDHAVDLLDGNLRKEAANIAEGNFPLHARKE